jgi:hypothetical protein
MHVPVIGGLIAPQSGQNQRTERRTVSRKNARGRVDMSS